MVNEVMNTSVTKKRVANTISLAQLFKLFPDDDACFAWVEKIRWKGVPKCAHCKGTNVSPPPPSKPHHYWCKPCRKHFTATTKTIMHSRKTSLQNWVIAMYSVMTARKSVSAMQLSKELGVDYKTAWYMLHRIREALSSGDLVLEKVVEVDATYVGGKEGNKHESKKRHAGRGTVGKTPVMGMREREGRVKAAPVTDEDKETVKQVVEQSIRPGATVYTDEHKGYSAIKGMPYNHETVNHGTGEYVRGPVHTNSVESIWAVFKRSITGTWRHVSRKHLHRYVDEATFRLNQGNCEVDTIDRIEAIVSRIGDKRIAYRELVS